MTAREDARKERVAVIPAQAGIRSCESSHWIPAFAGMTVEDAETAVGTGETA
jgi:hypothetical protein